MWTNRPLGPLEEAVLMAIVRIGSSSYGVSIRKEVIARTGHEIAVGAIYTTLSRLEEKGHITHTIGEPTSERGGRRKKHYRITAPGERALDEARRRASAVWSTGTVAEAQ